MNVFRVIHSTTELAERVAAVDAAEGANKEAALGSFALQVDDSPLQKLDARSDAYKQEVLATYRRLTDRASYEVEAESDINAFDPLNPDPFASHDPPVIGSYLGAVASVVKYFPVRPPGRVLDVGTGWGHTALTLARSGFQVDAVDINTAFLDQLGYWAERMHAPIRTHQLQFEEVGQLEGPYDAVLFFEAFHHAIDHSALLDACANLLAPHGAIVFAGEPIYPDWPTPWSLRYDSLAAYCIYKFGWMELGFNERYFVDLLRSKGFYVEKRVSTEFPAGSAFTARRFNNRVPFPALSIPAALEEGWHPGENTLRWTKGRAGIPSCLMKPGEVHLDIISHCPKRLPVSISVDEEVVQTFLIEAGQPHRATFELSDSVQTVWIDTPPWSPSDYGSTDTRTLGVAVCGLNWDD